MAYQAKDQLAMMGAYGQERVRPEFDIAVVFREIFKRLESI
jgi:hypothetical protein